MTFVGCDLHKRSITACALDESGAILAEIRQLSTSLDAVLVWLGALPRPVTGGMEATLYWEWLATRLAQAAHTVRVAHAFHVKLIWQARAKMDPIDARKLAELLRVNLFPSIWLPRRGIPVARVMTDNGSAHRSDVFAEVILEHGVRHLRTRPYTPRTNGKAVVHKRIVGEFAVTVQPRLGTSCRMIGASPSFVRVRAAASCTSSSRP